MYRFHSPSTRLLRGLAGMALLAMPALVTAESPSHIAMNHQLPAWAEQLKGQTIVEDAMSGRGERSAMVEQQHQRIMDHMSKDPQVQAVNTGMYNTSAMMHQYGAGGQDMLLMSDPRVEPVAATGGGKCPATAPVKQYNVSAINVEITLNQWLDFYPGYMYVLDEDIDKVRAEETTNREARDKDGFDPGAVIPGVQAQWIQPLTLRANQGDCVKIKLSNKLEGGEDVSLHIHGSSTVVSKTGAAAITTNSDAIASKDKPVELEWYIHPNTQEGVRQFHTYSNDRELTVMGMFGSFVVEPRGSTYWEPLGTGDATPATSGWQVMIKNGTGPDFREFVLYYHEVGDEAFRPLNKKGDFLPQRDPLTDTYRPGGRAINYRSEPFGINNMHLQHEYFGFEDESMGYSSYTFGDAAPT
ncbi:MAG: multicopper oxidase domain-containing protein, partial [Nitrospira sp.]|nr:multicopper oxidase domain-containing protein [Nitrospira sp.]